MQPQDLEPELEALLVRLAPDLADRWEGATDEEIEQIEQLAGRPLPRFYRWFLMRMGRDRGLLAYPSLDFSAQRVLSAYGEAQFEPHPRLLMIGYETDPDMPLHVFYDLDHPTRQDARVTRAYDPTEELQVEFETLREMLVWGEMLVRRVMTAGHRCAGVIESGQDGIMAHIAPVMHHLGFMSPISTGPYCTIFETDDSVLLTTTNPSREPRYHPFSLGGEDVGRMRRLLGQLAALPSLEVRVDEWYPPLR